MSVSDYIIIGGGISGLFMAYKLSETGKDILLLESTKRLGGRIYTTHEDGVQFELGAARISENHTKVMALLKELDIDTKKELVELPTDITYKLKGHDINFYSLVKDLQTGSKLISKSDREKVNLLQLCIDTLGYETAKLFQNKLGYDSEFELLNGYQAIKTYSKDLFSPCKYYGMTRGLSHITELLEMKLKDKKNVTIMRNITVTDIDKQVVHVGKVKHRGSSIVCCVPYKSIRRMSKFKDLTELNAITPVPLIRIYAKYPKDKDGKVWFHKLKRTITDNYIRHIIPIDYETGLIMISYTDGLYATMWRDLTKYGNKILIERLHKEVKTVTGLDPPDPDFITHQFWTEGVHMWKPGFTVNEMYEKLKHPFSNEKIYLVNEAFSQHQGWIEGSLDMCYDVLPLLDSSFKRNLPQEKGASTQHKPRK